MGLNLLEPILEESVEDASRDEVLHLVCMACNGGVVLPFMECYCGHWDGTDEVIDPSGHTLCEKCEEVWDPDVCPKGHPVRY